jgi:CRP/FNR family transcriptional regulator, cyclic AMP receptor protein
MGRIMTTDVLGQDPLFTGFTPEQLAMLCPLFIPCEYHTGTVLFEQGDPATHFYIVTTGEVAIHYKPEDDQSIVVARVRAGGIVGWSAVIGRHLYTSAAICTQTTSLLRVSGGDLQTLCTDCPETGNLFTDRLAEVVAERLRSSHSQVLAILESGLRTGTQNRVK